jgi:hypothetical protein
MVSQIYPVLPRIMEAADSLSAEQLRLLAESRVAADRQVSLGFWEVILAVALGLIAGIAGLWVVRQVAAALRGSTRQLLEMSRQLATAAQQIARSNEALAQGVTQQAASLEETSAATAEVSSMTQKNASGTRDVAELINADRSCRRGQPQAGGYAFFHARDSAVRSAMRSRTGSRWPRARLRPRAQAIQRGNPQRRREIAVRTAARLSDSSSSTPISRASSRALRKSATIPAERSIGGRFNPPLTSMVHRRSKGFSARNFFSSAGASRKRSTRISTSARASAATTLLRVPPGDHARIHRDAALQSGEARDALDLPRQFQHGAGARLEIHAGVRRAALHHHA